MRLLIGFVFLFALTRCGVRGAPTPYKDLEKERPSEKQVQETKK